jgi:predicted GNAT family acetyltransferase
MTVAPNETNPTIVVTDHPEGEFYELTSDGEPVGLLIYHVIGRRLGITHTVIREDHRGRGLSPVLIGSALDGIRGKDVTVHNRCEVVSRFVEKNPEYADLLDGPA